MYNQYDVGMQQDFDAMTTDIGRLMWIYPRNDTLSHEGQTSDETEFYQNAREEIIFLQELDTEHEVVASGQMDVGDVRFTFKHDSIAAEEGFVTPDEGTTIYKILKITKVRNQSNNEILWIKGYGRKVPQR